MKRIYIPLMILAGFFIGSVSANLALNLIAKSTNQEPTYQLTLNRKLDFVKERHYLGTAPLYHGKYEGFLLQHIDTGESLARYNIILQGRIRIADIVQQSNAVILPAPTFEVRIQDLGITPVRKSWFRPANPTDQELNEEAKAKLSLMLRRECTSLLEEVNDQAKEFIQPLVNTPVITNLDPCFQDRQ